MTTAPSLTDQQIKNERDRFVAFSFAAADMLLELTNDDGSIGYASGAAKAITGRDPKELMQCGLFSLFTPADRLLLHKTLNRIKDGGRIRHIPLQLVKPQGDKVAVYVGGCRLIPGGSIYVTMVLANTAEDHSAERDEDTGLLDAESFAEKARLAAEHEDCQLTFLEIPELQAAASQATKEKLEAFNHNLGAQLRNLSVGGDTAGKLSGNRYGIVHKSDLSILDVHEQVNDIAQGLDQTLAIESTAMDLQGANLCAEDTARALLYSINQFSEKGIKDFDISSLNEGIDSLMEHTIERVSMFRSSMDSDSFTLVFQPIVGLKNPTDIHHYEALSRFKEGRNTFEVIDFAEATGMIQEFDLTVCQRVLEHLLHMSVRKKNPTVAVNLSAQSLESSIFVQSLRKTMEKHPRMRQKIMFELTESSHIRNFEQANNVLQTLRRDGHMVCLDDVGAGATSFHYIRSFHVDYIKIDGSYVRNMLDDQRDIAFVRSIAELSRAIGSATIAEMVETEEEAKKLRQLGVEYGQGWLYGKPSPIFQGLETEATPQAGWKRQAG